MKAARACPKMLIRISSSLYAEPEYKIQVLWENSIKIAQDVEHFKCYFQLTPRIELVDDADHHSYS